MKQTQQDTPIRILGNSVRTNQGLESNLETSRIPGLWQTFIQQGGAQSIPEASSPAVYAVYSDYESDVSGDYTLTLGASSDVQDDALTPVTLPAGKYLVFEAEGPAPACTIQAWQTIWAYFADPNCEHARAYDADFEMYTAAEGVSVYIGIK
ncbi:MAG: GyrI-like domain-containing protein [Deinococcota bacterium]